VDAAYEGVVSKVEVARIYRRHLKERRQRTDELVRVELPGEPAVGEWVSGGYPMEMVAGMARRCSLDVQVREPVVRAEGRWDGSGEHVGAHVAVIPMDRYY